ncbi:ATP-dependent DNA ligase [Sphingopyxis terrae subsp. terrae NBRC 15098]|uniref:DNA ligase (ATP) n=1 Tax=Sphingopyxis terrae subsp. terrae NBRC 15098 TaxID=1219058 RepID=A0A142W185_9SPHN|nr:DNA ligase D [Sphingopyxis terrae]AMU95739.1 ATP-dependent DNA ligase [Sphingopyxis terrae subsp. terrae NBRC 15098]
MTRADPLAQYNKKRDFKLTPEPAGKVAKGGGNRFIVQKHDATRLHYDFRLEVDGVLKSWAVTKGPSANPDDKRLAVRTEDHPMAYADFEGVIPKGEYGGGSVMLWDRGTWAPVAGKSAKDLEKGHLHFTLDGERMKGEWLLVRMKPRAGEKRENWLLRKIDDAYAGGSDDLTGRYLTSVLTDRPMAEIAGDEDGEQSLKGAKGEAFAKKMAAAAAHNRKVAKGSKAGAKPPKFRKLQLATLVDSVPAGNNWFYEIKFDGYRALVAAAGDQVVVYTRSGLDWTDKFAPLARHIAALDLPPCLIDGEIVAYGKDGNPDFSSLQAVLKRGHGAQDEATDLHFFAFDLLEENGKSLTALGNLERKERLEALLRDAAPPIAVADHVIGAGEKLYEAMCGAGQEGIIAKRADAPYAGRRSKNWVKVKCTRRQEFIIVGWKESSAKARPFGSLLLAQREKGELVYKGNVGTGFDADTMAMLAAKFAGRARKTAPVDVDKAAARKVHWVRPDLVAEIAFAEYTASGSVRHASFVGLRADKEAKDVKPETKAKAPSPVSDVKISSRDRVIFPEAKATKGDLADYYAAVAPVMLPHLARRPASLVRCPQGRAKQCFFQKHDSGSFGPHVHHVPIEEKDGGVEDYLYVEDADGILACVQMGTIEFHGWGSHVDTLEQPDRMVFDLDPDEGLDFADVKKAAADLKRQLADIGLVSFAMLSGGKGVHVVVPLDPGHSWDAHKDFAKRFAEAMSLAEPDRFVATMSKAKRKGKIFIDWLRNQRGSTAIMPYSARARAGAPVAVPIDWDGLAAIDSARHWTIADARALLDRAASPTLKGWGFARQTLPAI